VREGLNGILYLELRIPRSGPLTINRVEDNASAGDKLSEDANTSPPSSSS
jgi:hypothetical protein